MSEGLQQPESDLSQHTLDILERCRSKQVSFTLAINYVTDNLVSSDEFYFHVLRIACMRSY